MSQNTTVAVSQIDTFINQQILNFSTAYSEDELNELDLSLRDDLELDDLDIVDICMAVETEFNMSLEYVEFPGEETFSFIEEKMGGNSGKLKAFKSEINNIYNRLNS